tara:strand:- start:72 stop:1481 length:1410 start_codon:yes stop_codon:yes gene_type:complete
MNRITNLPSTEILKNTDAAHHIHPFSNMGELNKHGTRVIVKGDGIFLFDNDGNKFLDAMSGLWCVNIGYGRTELAEIAAQQMKDLPYYNTFFGTTHPPATLLAEKVSSLAPDNLNHIFFSSSGSEANDTNIRLVRHYWASQGAPEKNIIISRTNSYHGSSMGSASLGGMKSMHSQGGMPIPDIIHINQPYWYAEGGDLSQEEFGKLRAKELDEKINQVGSKHIAAFIGEPVQGAGGVIIPPETYWPEIQKICKKNDILLIVDEVICGFGRTGNWFGSDTFSITPDIMTIAKGLSSGYLPIGGSIISDKIASALEKSGEEFNHGYTYSGHPVAAAVALENIRLLESENIIEQVRRTTAPYLSETWLKLESHPLVGEARTVGMLGAIELSPDPKTRAPFKAAPGTIGLITRDICIKNGLIMRHVYDKMIISPPLIINKEQIEHLVDLAWSCLDEAEKTIRQEGLMEIGTRN